MPIIQANARAIPFNSGLGRDGTKEAGAFGETTLVGSRFGNTVKQPRM